MSTETNGFDLVYQIDRDSLLAALDRLLVQNMGLRLLSLNLGIPIDGAQAPGAPAIPLGTLQSGTFQLASVPEATLTMPTTVDGNLLLQVDFSNTLLSLQVVPALAGINLFTGLRALAPTSSGRLRIKITLRLENNAAGGRLEVEFDKVSVEVDPLSALPSLAGLSPTNGIDLVMYGTRINQAIAQQVQAALATLPVKVNLPFGPRGLCDIGVRALTARLLPPASGRQASLGFFAELTDGGEGNIDNATTSTLDSAVEGSIALANHFVLDLVCCLLQHHPSITGLGESSHTDGCCRWQNINNVSFAGQTVKLQHMEVCIERSGVAAKFTVDIHVSKGGNGWTSHATAKFDINLQRSGNAIDANPANIELDDWIHKEFWVWLIEALVVIAGAVIGFFIGGGAGGAVAGGAIALAIVAVGDLIITTLLGAAAGALSGAIGALGATGMKLLPQELIDTFGGLSEIQQFEFDDLMVGGPVKKATANVLHEGVDIVLSVGDRFDLDRGVVFRAGQIPAGGALDADLIWRPDPLVLEVESAQPPGNPGGRVEQPREAMMMMMMMMGPGHHSDLTWIGSACSIAPLGSARMLALSGISFWSLTERDAKGVSYPGSLGNHISGENLPVSNTPYLGGTRVFVVRTTAGRFAKCAAWKDSVGQLHLTFVTWDTPLPLDIKQEWTVTRGPQVPSPWVLAQTFQVSRHANLEAKLGSRFPWIWGLPEISYEWFWDGASLSGTGILPDGTTQHHVSGKHLQLTSEMGAPLEGLLQVRATLPWISYVASRELALPGTETISQLPVFENFHFGPFRPPIPLPDLPRPTFPPLIEQLPAAISKGMRIPTKQVKLR